MSYIQALKKPNKHTDKACSIDYKNFPDNIPKILYSEIFGEIDQNNLDKCNEVNDADIEEEGKAKINKNFSVEIKDSITLEKSSSALFIGNLQKNKNNSEKINERKNEFVNFIDEYINYFKENDKTVVTNPILTTKRKKLKNYHYNYSLHNESESKQQNTSQGDELNSFYVLQNKKIIKSKVMIEEMRQTQKTLIREITDHQEREKNYMQVIFEKLD